MARVLVVFYSRTGTTKKVAATIAEALSADLEEVVDRTSRTGLRGYLRSSIDATFGRKTNLVPSKREPGDYDLVVLGSPTWNASVSSPVLTYIAEHRDALKKVAFFCTCGGRGGERVLRQMSRLCGREPSGTLVLRENAVSRGTYKPDVEGFARMIRGALERLEEPRPTAPASAAAPAHA